MKNIELMDYKFVLDPNDNVITLSGFETDVDYAKEELEWYYSGDESINYSERIRKTWKKFSDDGKKVNSCYGSRIFGKHPRISLNQWEWVKKTLKKDNDTRQAVININSYFDKEKPTKDFTCAMYFHLILRDNKLNWYTYMRSNDIYLGVRNDVYCFTEMQKRMAKELNVELGEYRHFCGLLQVYENQFKKLRNFLIENGLKAEIEELKI